MKCKEIILSSFLPSSWKIKIEIGKNRIEMGKNRINKGGSCMSHSIRFTAKHTNIQNTQVPGGSKKTHPKLIE